MKPKIKEILFDSFAVVFIAVGFAIHSWPSFCFLLVGSICGSFALYYTLLNHRAHEVPQTQARNWACLLFAIFLVGAILYWKEYKQPEHFAESKVADVPSKSTKPNLSPHFLLSVISDDDFDKRVELTNDFLFPTNWNGRVSIAGVLCLPAKSTQTKANLRVAFKNDSLIDAEDSQVLVGVSSNLRCVPEPGWDPATGTLFGNGNEIYKLWDFDGKTTLSNEGQVTPRLEIAVLSSNEVGTIGIKMRVKGGLTQILEFNVVFAPNTYISQAIIIESSNFMGKTFIPIPRSVNRLPNPN